MMPKREIIRWRLAELLEGMAEVPSLADVPISAITLDSRRVLPGALFIAIAGHTTHGAAYCAEAIANGAQVIISDQPVDQLGFIPSIPLIQVSNLRRKLGCIADRYYLSPSQKMTTFGVTGTNGKTTVAHIIAQAFDALGRSACYIGTLGAGRVDSLQTLANTTPDVIRLHGILAEQLNAGCKVAAVEVSSHALVQGRLDAMEIDTAIFTNLGHDHLDYHGDLDTYAAAKRRLFERPELAAAVINSDDALGREILGSLSPSIESWSYGKASPTAATNHHVAIVAVETQWTGVTLTIEYAGEREVIHSSLLGDFNAENLTAALTAMLSQGVALKKAAVVLTGVKPIPGRMERFGIKGHTPTVVVDYAHTPDSLSRALSSVRSLATHRLLCVFGCGGDRDVSKRPLMGEIVDRIADRVFITSDNPRSESNEAIAADIVATLADQRKITFEADRETAIRRALTEATINDIVFIAGKGHERFQEVAGERHFSSDQAIVREALKDYR